VAAPARALPRISIVVPSFNQAAYLPATLDSLFSQAYPALEVLVIDGGSSDDSAAIIARYAARHPHALPYWTSEPDRGQSHAINKGFARSTGEVLSWLNSDDVLLPGALAAVGQVFAAHPHIAWLTGQPANLRGQPPALHRSPLPVGRVRAFIRRGWYHGRGLGFIRQEGTFWRRALWEQAGGAVDEARHYSMDFDLWRRFAAHAPLVSLNVPLAAFREHAAQKTTDLDAYYREAGIAAPRWLRYPALAARVLLNPLLWAAAPRLRIP
jgi:glycosyltransferase involved in cell wall biosynthesis